MNNQDIISTVVIAIILLIIYYFGTYQRRKQQKELQKIQDNLKKGDKVITVSGISGEVDDIIEDIVILKTGPDSVRISVEKWAIATLDERK